MLWKSPIYGRYYDVLHDFCLVDGPNANGLLTDRAIKPDTLKQIESEEEFNKVLGL